jgi:hypothetical protein
VFDVLDERHRRPVPERWQVADFRCEAVADDAWLVTCTLDQEGRISRRASLWRRAPDGWKILSHQGTPAS